MMRIVAIIIWQRQHDQVGRFVRFEAAGLVLPAEGFGAGERRHAQQRRAGKVRVKAMQEACLFQDAQIRVGGKAVGAEGDPNTALQEGAKWMRRMAEGGVSART